MPVTSSIEDGAHLGAALEWQAHVQSTQHVTAVDFLIDGRREWTEQNAPYFFNDDHFLLQPWLLGNGRHTLSIKATDSSGATSTTTSHVTVKPAPAVPPALLATYRRNVTSIDYARSSGMAGYDANNHPPTGTWTIRFQKDYLIALGDPSNVSGENEAFAAEPSGDLTLAGPANWLTPLDLRGGLCEGSPVDHYHWSISGKVLTIGGGSNCPNRKALFDGRWTRR